MEELKTIVLLLAMNPVLNVTQKAIVLFVLSDTTKMEIFVYNAIQNACTANQTPKIVQYVLKLKEDLQKFLKIVNV